MIPRTPPRFAFSCLLAFSQGMAVEVFNLDAFIVNESPFPTFLARSMGEETGLQPSEADLGNHHTVALALSKVTGVSVQRRGADSLEPVIRGLGFERIATSLNGLPLPAASPTRTGAPVNYLGPGSVDKVDLIRFFPSATLGPFSTGSRIELRSVEFTTKGHGTEIRNKVGLLANSARGGVTTHASRSHQTSTWGLRYNLYYSRLGDYPSADGTRVDADYEAWGASFAGAAPTADSGNWKLAAHFARQDLARNNALPLDTRGTDFFTFTIEREVPRSGGLWNWRSGFASVAPHLDSNDRPVIAPSLFQVEAASQTRILYSRLGYLARTLGATVWQAGVDCSFEQRDAERRRFLADGTVFLDRIWPDLRTARGGLFIEVLHTSNGTHRLRVSGRLDYQHTEANGLDSSIEGLPNAKGQTVRENFVAFHGSGAGRDERDTIMGGINLVLEHLGLEGWMPYYGIGLTRASAGVTEQYRAFLNALGGGLELGNPELSPETKWEAAAGLVYEGSELKAQLEVHQAWIFDFIERRVIDPVGPVYSFCNNEARIVGIDLALKYAPEFLAEAGLSGTIAASWVEGHRRDSGLRLPVIPPWEMAGTLHWEGAADSLQPRLRLGLRKVGKGTSPDPLNNPLFRDTDAYELWHLALGLRSNSGWSVEVRVDNLFDLTYFEYLQPPVTTGVILPSDGSLQPGDSIPGPSRYLEIRLNWAF